MLLIFYIFILMGEAPDGFTKTNLKLMQNGLELF